MPCHIMWQGTYVRNLANQVVGEMTKADRNKDAGCRSFAMFKSSDEQCSRPVQRHDVMTH